MRARGFDIGEAIRFGARTTFGNLGFFVILMIIVGAIPIALNFAQVAVTEEEPTLSFLMSVVAFLVYGVIGLGIARIALKWCDDTRATLDDLFSQTHRLPSYVVAAVIANVATFVGLLLFIIPGIIVAIRLQFYTLLIVDRGLGPIAALRTSWEISRGFTFRLFLFGIVLIAIALAGMLAFLVGLLIALPIVFLAQAWVFRRLLDQSEFGVEEEPFSPA